MSKIRTIKQKKAIFNRLDYLARMLNRYSHRWNENPSSRMYAWVDEYNELATSERETFREYCEYHGLAYPHDAYDCLA